MTFDYRTLKRAASEGQRLGNWNGKAVFAAGSHQLDNLGSGAFYILYDDENKIVAKTQNGWRSYGEVSESGSVNEYGSPRKYTTAAEAAAAARKTNSAAALQTSGMRYSSEPIPQAVAKVNKPEYVPGYDATERPVGDVKLEIDVEATLKKAREMTVADLLEGLNFGVDIAKG